MKTETCGVIFDMDGVLVLSDEAHFKSWRSVASTRGVEMTRELFLSTFGQVNEDCIATIFGEDTPAAEVQRIADEKERTYRDIVRAAVPLAAGLFELLGQLRAAGARLAVGSSAPPENVDLILDAGSLREFFVASVNGKQVTHGKPAPDVFLIAAQELGCDPARCVVIEDAPVGIVAARAAGMRAVAVATTNDEADLRRAGAHLVAADLESLELDQIFGPLGS